MRTKLLLTSTFLLSAQAAAQLAVDSYSIGASGDAKLTGGDLSVQGSVGQHTSSRMHGGLFALTAGFWDLPGSTTTSGISAVETTAGPGRVLVRWTGSRRDVAFYSVARSIGANNSAVSLGTVQAGRNGTFAFLDKSADPRFDYTYLLSEGYNPGPVLPRTTVRGRAYGTTTPPGLARVGPDQPLKTIDAAIAAANPALPHFTVSIGPGTYPPFTVDGTAHRELHIVADGTGPVRIDTSSGPVVIRGRNLLQNVELRGLTIDASTSTHPGLRIEQNVGAVILDTLLVRGGTSQPGVQLDAAVAVTLQRCDVTGAPGLALAGGSRAYASLGSLDRVTVQGTSRITFCELVPGSATVESGSERRDLTGTMPVLDTAPFVPTGSNITVDVRSVPSSAFIAVLATQRLWLEIPGIEMPLITSPAALLLTIGGAVDATGRGRLVLPLPARAEGLKLQLQALSIAATQPPRFSTLTSMRAVRSN